MSGHSKWSKIKHQKETTDAVKGKVFTKLANAIIIAVREGGGIIDPTTNFKLRLAIEKARDANIPKENIERAIQKGKGGEGGEGLSEIVYEAFGPAGVGIIIQTATDNKQRTVAELKNILERGGGVLGTTGSVSHFFEFVGCIQITKEGRSYDEIMEGALSSGAIDLEEEDDHILVYTNPTELHKVKKSLLTSGFPLLSIELIYRPKTTIPIQDERVARQILKLLSTLEEREDVQKVFANFDIPDAYYEAILPLI